jgi:DNA repair protein RadC
MSEKPEMMVDQMSDEALLKCVLGASDLEGLRGRYPEAKTLSDLMRISAIDQSHDAIRLQGAMEIARRVMSRKTDGESFSSSRMIVRRWRPRLAAKTEEQFWVMYLDAKNRLIMEAQMGASSVTTVALSPRQIYTMGVRVGAVSMVLVHNHPSGDPTPSPEDVKLTQDVFELGRLLDMPVLDHVIVAATDSFSFLDAGLLRGEKA